MFSLFQIAIAHSSELDASCNLGSRVGFPMENIPEIEIGCHCHLCMIAFFPLLQHDHMLVERGQGDIPVPFLFSTEDARSWWQVSMHSVIHTGKCRLAERSSERGSHYSFQAKYKGTIAAELCLLKNLRL